MDRQNAIRTDGGIKKPLDVDRLAHFHGNLDYIEPVSRSDLHKSSTKESGVCHHDPLAGLEQVGHPGIEASRSRAGHQVWQFGRAHHLAQSVERFGVQFDPEVPIVSDHLLAQGLQILVIKLSWACDHQLGHLWKFPWIGHITLR
jgi:hypothetical protein